MHVKRITLDGTWQAVTFEDINCIEFFVKNFGADDILVTIDETPADDSAIKIVGGMAESVSDGCVPPSVLVYQTIYIKGTAGGEVEVDVTAWSPYREA